jgi:hypothetical protein
VPGPWLGSVNSGNNRGQVPGRSRCAPVHRIPPRSPSRNPEPWTPRPQRTRPPAFISRSRKSSQTRSRTAPASSEDRGFIPRPVGVEVARPGSPAAGRLSVRCRGRSSSWTGSCGRPISCAGFRSPTDLAETVAGVVHIASNVSCPARARRRGLRRGSRTGPPLIWADLWHPNAVLAARDPGAAAPMLWRGTSQSRRRESDGEVLLVPHFGRG